MKNNIKERLVNKKIVFVILQFFLLQIIVNKNINAQFVTINGIVTASSTPVQNASVVFIDNNDTTKKYTAITDASGKYSIMLTSLASDNNTMPVKFQLDQNYPNPFNSTTSISYRLNQQSDVKVTIYDILGRVVRKFTIGVQQAGTHSIQWSGLNNLGERLAAGVYLYQMQAGNEVQVKKMVFNSSAKIASGSYPTSYPLALPQIKKVSNKIAESRIFTVKISNTAATSPEIISQIFTNQIIQSSTTLDFSVTSVASVPNVNIYKDSTLQIIRGFGASNILNWRPDMTNSEIQTAFGSGTGQLGFSILRIMVEPDSTRWSLYLPTVKTAQSMGATVIASPWYAPTNMVETVNGVSRVRHDMYNDYANHLNSFIKYMTKNGTTIYGLSIQNEPDITDQWTSWTANEIHTFMHNNAGAITGTKVMAPESFHFNRSYSDPILNDSVSCSNTDIICGHIYGGGTDPYPLALQKGKEIWMTEYLINSNGNGANMDTSWTAALATASSINSCMIANMSSYVWWYIVRYYGPIGDGTFGQVKGSVTKKGYVMSQFARFIRPGFYRIKCNNISQRNVYVTSYKDSNSKLVIVVINLSSSPVYQTFSIPNSTITIVTPYSSTSSKKCVQGNNINVVNSKFTVNLEASSVTTFVSN